MAEFCRCWLQAQRWLFCLRNWQAAPGAAPLLSCGSDGGCWQRGCSSLCLIIINIERNEKQALLSSLRYTLSTFFMVWQQNYSKTIKFKLWLLLVPFCYWTDSKSNGHPGLGTRPPLPALPEWATGTLHIPACSNALAWGLASPRSTSAGRLMPRSWKESHKSCLNYSQDTQSAALPSYW